MPPAAAPAVRHAKEGRDKVKGLTKSAILRLARKGGCKRVSANVVPEIRIREEAFLRAVIDKAIIYAEGAKRKTVRAIDIMHALQRQGRSLLYAA